MKLSITEKAPTPEGVNELIHMYPFLQQARKEIKKWLILTTTVSIYGLTKPINKVSPCANLYT